MKNHKPVIVIDTREKKPYAFNSARVGSVKKALPAGDYSLEGYENQVVIERKTLTDFISTVVHNKPRFQAELLKLKNYKFAWIILESSIEEIFQEQYRSAIKPKALFEMSVAIHIQYIPILFCGNRPCAIKIVESLLVNCYKILA